VRAWHTDAVTDDAVATNEEVQENS